MMMGKNNRNNLLALVAPFSTSFLLAAAQQKCYYPNGLVAEDYTFVRCNTTTAESACCIPSEGDVCLSNNLCYWPSGKYPFRGACTDDTWTSDACPKYCLDADQNGWLEIQVCGGGEFCCGEGCCSTSTTFSIAPAVVVNSFGTAGAVVPVDVLGTSLPTSTSATDTAKSTSSGSSGSSLTLSSTATATSSPPPDSSSTNNGKIIAIGVGVGMGFGLLFAALLAFLCYRYYRSKKNPAVPPPQHPYQQHQQQQQQYIPPPQQHQQQQYTPPPQQPQPQQYPPYPSPPPHHQYPISTPAPAPPYYSAKTDSKEATAHTAPSPAPAPAPTMPEPIEMDATGAANQQGAK